MAMSTELVGGRLRWRLERAWRVYGPIGIVRLVGRRLKSGPRSAAYFQHPFDEKFGVETAGNEDIFDMIIPPGTPRETQLYATRNQATPPELFTQMIASSPLQPDGSLFLDVGCGKGRMLLLASDYPFATIMGVELATNLAVIAARNVERYRSQSQRCREIHVVAGDATQVEFPPLPTVLFMANPFVGPVLVRFLERLEASLKTDPRPMVILYRHQPESPSLANQTFSLITGNEFFQVYAANLVSRSGRLAVS